MNWREKHLAEKLKWFMVKLQHDPHSPSDPLHSGLKGQWPTPDPLVWRNHPRPYGMVVTYHWNLVTQTNGMSPTTAPEPGLICEPSYNWTNLIEYPLKVARKFYFKSWWRTLGPMKSATLHLGMQIHTILMGSETMCSKIIVDYGIFVLGLLQICWIPYEKWRLWCT
jgi:hypothetical protein